MNAYTDAYSHTVEFLKQAVSDDILTELASSVQQPVKAPSSNVNELLAQRFESNGYPDVAAFYRAKMHPAPAPGAVSKVISALKQVLK